MRRKIRQLRLALPLTFCRRASRQIAQTVFSLPEFQFAETMAIYLPTEKEVDTQLICDEAWKQNKKIYLPVLGKNKTLCFHEYKKNDRLKKTHWGIDEPDKKTAEPIEAKELDLVIVPLVGFSKACYRLGRGTGCYDITFSFLKSQAKPAKPTLVGLAYEIQKVEFIPEEWDVPLDHVITEIEIYRNL